MIYRWIRSEIAQLIHVKCFSKFLEGLKVLSNMVNNDFTDFLFCGHYFACNFQTVYPIDANDMV
jgi:hypothetical protein